MDTALLTLVVFSLLGGTGSAIAVMNFAAKLGGKAEEGEKNSAFTLYLVALILLGVGLLASLLHLGQPLRFLNGLSNPSSMISQESYWAIGLGVLLLICVVLAKLKGEVPLALRGVTAFAAGGLLIVSALAYALPLGMPGWNDGSTVPFLILGNLILGAAVIVLIDKAETVQARMITVFIAVGASLTVAGIGYLVNLMRVGLDFLILPLIASLLVGAIAPAILAAYKTMTKASASSLITLIAVLAIVGLAAARVVFFSAGIHI